MWITFYQSVKKFHCFRVFNFLRENFYKDGVIYAVEEFLDITFQCVAGLRIILTFLVKHLSDRIHSFMSAFADTARKGSGDKGWFKNGIKNLKESMVQNSVSDCGLMNMPKLGVGNKKASISSMLVFFTLKFSTQLKNILFQVFLKDLHVIFGSFIFAEFFPSEKQVFGFSNFRK